jgi:hypothetical protein
LLKGRLRKLMIQKRRKKYRRKVLVSRWKKKTKVVTGVAVAVPKVVSLNAGLQVLAVADVGQLQGNKIYTQH